MSNLPGSTYLLSASLPDNDILPDGKLRYLTFGNGVQITGEYLQRLNIYEQVNMLAEMVSQLSATVVELKRELAEHKRDIYGTISQVNESIDNLEEQVDGQDEELTVLSERLEVHKEPRRKKVKLNVPKYPDGIYSYRPLDNIYQAFLIEMSDGKWSNIIRQSGDGNSCVFHQISHMQLAYEKVEVVRWDRYVKSTWIAFKDRIV